MARLRAALGTEPEARDAAPRPLPANGAILVAALCVGGLVVYHNHRTRNVRTDDDDDPLFQPFR